MAKNKVQFQKGFSWYILIVYLAPKNVVGMRFIDSSSLCQRCQATAYSRIKRRQYLQCISCKRQYSLRAGTMMAYSQISLKQWFMALYLLTQSKKAFHHWH